MPMLLSSVRKGSRVRIAGLPAGDMRSQLIRLGLMEGTVVECLERLPGGTLVLLHSRQEVAVSTELAASITVSSL
jgi:Fe2+ transport system protein FeoA